MLGHMSKYETRIAVDNDGVPCAERDGGTLTEKQPKTSVKFPGEARGCFGIGMVKMKGGDFEGRRAAIFDYTGQWIIGVKKYEAAKKSELARVKRLEGPGVWGGEGDGYQERWPDDWEEKLDEKMHGPLGLRCITDIMDHVVSESKRLYKGTKHAKDFMIFHDGLSAWWEEESQEHLAMLGFRDRQLRCLGDTNRDSRYYGGKLVGDSPELCVGLDSHGFAHLKVCMDYNLAVSSRYDVGDPRRMGMGTPAEVMDTMQKCWSLAPTSEQIVADVLALPEVLRKIIDARGCVVKDLDLRSGRRYIRADGKGDLMRKPRTRQQKDTMVSAPCHPDNIEARTAIRDNIEVITMSLPCSDDDDSSGDDEVVKMDGGGGRVQTYEIGARVRNIHNLSCTVIAYDADTGQYEVQYTCDDEIWTIEEHQLRPAVVKTSTKRTSNDYSYEVIPSHKPVDTSVVSSASIVEGKRQSSRAKNKA